MDGKTPILVPIPLSPVRLRERGYNQLDLVLEELSHIAPGFAPQHILEKIRETESQTKTASRADRIKNLAGCFRVVAGKEIYGKSFLLLDDVITTGTTLCEAKKTLLEAGARHVECLALAH